MGGVDTEMYRTGHSCLLHKPLPHFAAAAVVVHSAACAPSGVTMSNLTRGLLNTQQGETLGMVSLLLSAWWVRTDQ